MKRAHFTTPRRKKKAHDEKKKPKESEIQILQTHDTITNKNITQSR
jgi:hypothetical protein